MARYEDDDSDTGRTLLITAAVIAGLLAGAVVAHRLGGLKGVRRFLSRRGGPLLSALSAAFPAGTLATLLDIIGIDEIIASLLSGGRRLRAGRRHRHSADDLDEYEVDDVDRAVAGFDDDDDDDDDDDEEDDDDRRPLRRTAFVEDDEDEDEDEAEAEDDEIVDSFSPEAIEQEVLAAFRRHTVLRHRALEIAVDEDGVVELTGWVRRERDVRIARRVAAAVPGVERVVVDVAVRDVTPIVSDAEATGA